jgi:hypothetical protein
MRANATVNPTQNQVVLSTTLNIMIHLLSFLKWDQKKAKDAQPSSD